MTRQINDSHRGRSQAFSASMRGHTKAYCELLQRQAEERAALLADRETERS